MDHLETHVLDAPATEGFVYGVSPTIQTVNDMAAEIARTDISVLIVGESGSGKDAYARLHSPVIFEGQAATAKKLIAQCLIPNQLIAQMRQPSRNVSYREAYWDHLLR